ncbi:MAG TPA: TadE/TadG family type IV pilus assembly protein [Longimicrobiales bacterium]
MTRVHVTRQLRNRPGQGLVEFVLIAPVLLLLILGLIEFARAWNIRHVITDAAREGARNLAIDNNLVTPDSVLTLINRNLAASRLQAATWQPPDAAGSCSPAPCVVLLDGGGAVGSQARVHIRYPYDLGVVRTLLGWAVPQGQLNITTTFVMRNE